jgi:hypothetical protein
MELLYPGKEEKRYGEIPEEGLSDTRGGQSYRIDGTRCRNR